MKIIPSEFTTIVSDTGRPDGSWGSTVTPAQNAYGSYATILAGASLTYDAYGIEIDIGNVGASAQSKNCLVTMGLDPAGGTTFTDWINHLMASSASGRSTANAGGNVRYRFPIFIKAGTTIGAKASVDNASLAALQVAVKVFVQPSRPESIWWGTFVQTFGATTASSSGTAVTSGEASEGAWAELGTLDKVIRYWDLGVGFASDTFTTSHYHCDLGIGDASNKKVVITDALVHIASTENLAKFHCAEFGSGAVGDKVYGRAQCNTTATPNMSMIAYGCG